MPFVPIPSCVKVEIPFLHPGRAVTVNVVAHVRMPTSGPYLPSTLGALADSVMTHLSTSFPSLLPSTAAIQPVVATDITVVTGNQEISSLPAIPGSNTHSILPPQCAACISMYTLIRGRSYRGRMYWPCVSESSLDVNGNLTITATGEYDTYAAALAGNVETDTGALWCVASRKLAITTVVEQFVTRFPVRTQRRREADHG